MSFYDEPSVQYSQSSEPRRRLILPDDEDDAWEMGITEPKQETVVETKRQRPRKKKCGKGGCKGWCWPFIIYLILSVITIIFFLFSKQDVGVTITYVLLQLIWIIIIAFIIYWLCKSGKVGWAWFVLFLPLIIQVTWVVLSAIF